MGVMIRVSCRSCKEDWQCRTGCGMMHGNLENAAASYPAEIRKEIYANVQGEYPLFDFSYQPARCMYCHGIAICHCSIIYSIPWSIHKYQV